MADNIAPSPVTETPQADLMAYVQQERDAYRKAATQMHNAFIGYGMAGAFNGALAEDGVRLFDEAEAVSGRLHGEDLEAVESWKGKYEAAAERLTSLEAGIADLTKERDKWKSMFEPVDAEIRKQFDYALMGRLLDNDERGVTRLGQFFVAWYRADKRAAALEAGIAGVEQEKYQQRVRAWVLECFGKTIADDMVERSFRFLEEALELAQSVGCTREQAHALVDYVQGRPVGETGQEVGGVMVTLAAFTSAAGIDLEAEAERELARINAPETIAKIRRKQASKRGVVSHAAQAALPGAWSE